MQARRKSHSRKMCAGASAVEFTSNLSRKSKTTRRSSCGRMTPPVFIRRMPYTYDEDREEDGEGRRSGEGEKEAVGNKSGGKTLAIYAGSYSGIFTERIEERRIRFSFAFVAEEK